VLILINFMWTLLAAEESIQTLHHQNIKLKDISEKITNVDKQIPSDFGEAIQKIVNNTNKVPKYKTLLNDITQRVKDPPLTQETDRDLKRLITDF
jgi:DNA-binding transcriptional regulator GbsR (MarR family)